MKWFPLFLPSAEKAMHKPFSSRTLVFRLMFLFFFLAFSIAVCAQAGAQQRERRRPAQESSAPGNARREAQPESAGSTEDAEAAASEELRKGAAPVDADQKAEPEIAETTEEDAEATASEEPREGAALGDAGQEAEPEIAETTEEAAAGPMHGRRIPSLTIPIPENNRLVERFKREYETEEGLEYLSIIMKRSAPYREFILAEADRLGAPDFLLYLPVVESSFSERAVSNAGAAGIWQFMKNSISGYGIKIDEWRDERRDPWISTTAALRKLLYNFNYLGDWYLALAAYNCGLAAVTRAVRNAGTDNYWELSEGGYLYRETVNYVPKFLAIAEILSRSEELGIDWGEAIPVSELDVLMVNKSVNLNVLARESGEDPALFRKLNPSLYYSITPPDKEYALRIPAAKKELIVEILNSGKPLIEYYVYKIRSGDTLYALSRHYGVSVDMIEECNPGIRPEALRIGSNVLIPALSEVEEYRGDGGDTQFTGTYLVKQGDSLWSIARAYNIKMETLAEKNGIDLNGILSLGKVLKVPAF